MDQVKIGRFIADERKALNLTQTQLAEKLGVTDRAISKWENGRGLPEVSLMKPLCAILGITLSELLEGERADKDDTESIADKNVLEALRERERESLKKEHMQKVCGVLVAVLLILTSLFGLRAGTMIFAGLRGEGYSVSCFFNTHKAETAAKLIVGGDYEKAVKHIAFSGKHNKETAREEWMKNMQAIDEEICIEEFEVSKIIFDDYCPMGKYYMVVFDRQTQIKYIFDGIFTVQDGGIAFGGIYVPDMAQDRRTQIAHTLEKAMVTFNPG